MKHLSLSRDEILPTDSNKGLSSILGVIGGAISLITSGNPVQLLSSLKEGITDLVKSGGVLIKGNYFEQLSKWIN